VPTIIQFSSIEPFVVAEDFDRVNQHLSQQGPGLFNRLVGDERVRVLSLARAWRTCKSLARTRAPFQIMLDERFQAFCMFSMRSARR
jgi:hypothetical protein